MEEDNVKMNIEEDIQANSSIGTEENDSHQEVKQISKQDNNNTKPKTKYKPKKKGIKTENKNKDKDEKRGKKKGPFKDVNTMRHTFKNIIYDVLYNVKERTLVDKSNIKKAEDAASDCIFKYRRKCITQTNERPNFWEDFGYIQSCDDKRQRLFIVGCSEEKLTYYSELCFELWNIMTECCYRSELKISTLTPISYVLGILYMLIVPIYSEDAGRQIIPDEYLDMLLPGPSDLFKWTHGKYNTSVITEGQKYIKNTMSLISSDIRLREYGKIYGLFYKYHNIKEMKYYSDHIPLKFLFF